MIRRLVEDQVIGLFEQHPGEHRARALAAGEFGDRAVEVARVEAERVDHRVHAVLDRRPPVAFERFVRRAVAPQEPLLGRAVTALRRGRHFDFERAQLAFVFVDALERGGQQSAQGRVGALARGLREIAQARIAGPHEVAAIGLVDAGEDAHERRFPGPIRADQADALAVAQRTGNAAEDLPCSVVPLEIAKPQPLHTVSVTAVRRSG